MMRSVVLCVYGSFLVQFAFSQGNIPSSDGGTGLSQIDLEAAKEVTVCTMQKRPLSCSYPGSNIAIQNVFWGRRSGSICPSDDGDTVINCDTSQETEGIVKAKCEGKESCELEARHAALQNPQSSHCPGVNKYLIINYTCVPDAKEVVLCDSENSTLTCPASWKIGVNSVFWGRQSTVICPAENGQTTCTGAPESLGIVKKSCDGLPRCDIHASFDQVQNGAENCPGVSKYLIINYSCMPHPNIETDESTEVKQAPEYDDQVKQLTSPEPPQNNESVEKALNQLDGDPKSSVESPAEGKEDLNIGRLGMGGLKALEKINNLIKSSAEAQGGDESLIENGLTDDQAQTIERMIIEGIKNIKTKKPNSGRRKTAIPRRTGQQNPNAPKGGLPKVPANLKSAVDSSHILKQKVKNTMYKLRIGKPSALKGLIRSDTNVSQQLNANQTVKNNVIINAPQQLNANQTVKNNVIITSDTNAPQQLNANQTIKNNVIINAPQQPNANQAIKNNVIITSDTNVPKQLNANQDIKNNAIPRGTVLAENRGSPKLPDVGAGLGVGNAGAGNQP